MSHAKESAHRPPQPAPPQQTMTEMMQAKSLGRAEISEIIEMALSDHTSFAQIRALYGLGPDQVKSLMRANLARGSYRAWRKRVRIFSDRRERYK